ncbi:MAG: peptide-methionine (S)-S-oxide reductase MsrA [Candidatus Sungbacteria bacterium]|nr:peptide-methionine (S)-S-oxide reductase MsrA [Candidatus Sungbacteria bacterium]
METIVFGGGCFWCTEAVFGMLKGVLSVTPGYAGGSTSFTASGGIKPPTYEEVSIGDTGYAEVIKIEFNPAEISFRDLLTVFFATHDPTTLNRQGSDVGAQYRSIILYTNEAQKIEAESFIKEIDALHSGGAPVVTEVKPLENFYEAEEYHRDYYAKNKEKSYCQLVINPKLEKVQREFAELLKEKGK